LRFDYVGRWIRRGRRCDRRRFDDLGGSGEELPLVGPAVRMLWAALASRGHRRRTRWYLAVVAPIRASGSGGSRRTVTRSTTATRAAARVLEAEWRREGKVLARSRTEFDAQRMPARARMDFPEERARFELTVVSVDTAAVLDPAIWRGRR